MKKIKLFENKENCCGCGACYAVCPKSAITMQEDEEGFLYPQINPEKCIGCKKCLSVCSFKNPNDASFEETKFYAARVKDKQILLNSSSGGMFTALTDYLFENEYAVCCSVYDYEKNTLEFKIVEDKVSRDKAIGSKYMQSDSKDIFESALYYLKNNPNKNLIFIGTGCQAETFREYIQKNNYIDRVIVVDIICHGVPSKKIFLDYVKYISGNENFDYLTFKDKRNGWLKPYSFIKVDGKELPINKKVTYNLNVIRPSCNVCPFTKTKRNTDITIGDFWGIDKKFPEFYSKEGNSLVLIHNRKGLDLFQKILPAIEYVECNVEDCLQNNLMHPTYRSKNRDEFWKDYENKPFSSIVKKYGTDSFYKKVRKRISKIKKRLFK